MGEHAPVEVGESVEVFWGLRQAEFEVCLVQCLRLVSVSFFQGFILFYFILFIYFLAVLGLRFCARAFSSCGKRGPLFIAVRGPLTITASRCRAQAPDAQAQQLWLTGLVAPQHVGSSQTRARTRVPCIGRQTLNHCATREAPTFYFKYMGS